MRENQDKVYYRVKDWGTYFENNRTRDMKKMAWVPVPNKHDGESYKRIMQQKDGITIYGCWHLILQVASKTQVRGTLLRDDGTPITAEAIALRTGWNRVEDFERAFQFLSSTEVGWLEQLSNNGAEIPQEPAEIPQEPAWKGREGKGIEGNGIISCPELAGQPPDQPAVISIPLIPSQGEYGITQHQIDEWKDLFPGVDVLQTLREIRAWNLANPTRRKTMRGVARHIVAWLSKEQCKA